MFNYLVAQLGENAENLKGWKWDLSQYQLSL